MGCPSVGCQMEWCERRGHWRPAARNFVITVMGGTELDFRELQLPAGETELVVLVTPQIIAPESRDIREGIQRFEDLKRESDEAMKPRLKD